MANAPFVIIGAGGYGREVLDMLDQYRPHDSVHLQFAGFVDEGEPVTHHLDRLGAEHLGGIEALGSLRGCYFIVAIADPSARKRLAIRARLHDLVPVTLIHGTASLGRDVHIGVGSLVCAGARITTNVTIGAHVLLNQNVTVGHDVTMADFVTVNPLAAVSGASLLEEGVSVGTGATVNPGVQIGANALVGAGAVVVRNVPANETVVGVPARPIAPSSGRSRP